MFSRAEETGDIMLLFKNLSRFSKCYEHRKSTWMHFKVVFRNRTFHNLDYFISITFCSIYNMPGMEQMNVYFRLCYLSSVWIKVINSKNIYA